MVEDKTRNIILVDDDPITIQLCNMVFKRTIPSARIVTFENGLMALEWIRAVENSFEETDHFVVLLDLNMPVLDGWGFLNDFLKLKEATEQKFSIYILTSSVDVRDLNRSKQYDCVKGFFSKPLTHKMIEQIFSEIDRSNEEK